eukprot:scaffold88355_cov78-Phaeocystis_antarctica.AAC.1
MIASVRVCHRIHICTCLHHDTHHLCVVSVVVLERQVQEVRSVLVTHIRIDAAAQQFSHAVAIVPSLVSTLLVAGLGTTVVTVADASHYEPQVVEQLGHRASRSQLARGSRSRQTSWCQIRQQSWRGGLLR